MRGGLELVGWTLLVWLCGLIGSLGMRHGVLSMMLWVAFLLIPVGAFVAAERCRRRLAFFIFGCAASPVFMSVVIPNPRFSLGRTSNPSTEYVIALVVSTVLVCGILAQVVAAGRHLRLDALNWRDRYRCAECDYLLYGLTEPRCPECGEPFDRSLLRGRVDMNDIVEQRFDPGVANRIRGEEDDWSNRDG